MSWLKELEYTFKYKCPAGHLSTMKEEAESIPCKECGKPARYSGFEPIKLRQTHNVEYDQNGRKAVRIRGKNGEIQHISKTKLHYMKTGRIEPQYTESYQKKLQKEQQEQLLRTEHSRRRGQVSQAQASKAFKEKIGSLPDGEYVTNGRDVIAPAPDKQK